MKNILFIHDTQEDPFFRKQYLENVGFNVSMHSSGNNCLTLIEETRPDIVMMDILLKGKNGFDVCRAIRKKLKADDMPVILCSGIYRKKVYRDEARNAGAQAYMLKPIDQYELVKKIHSLTSMVTLST